MPPLLPLGWQNEQWSAFDVPSIRRDSVIPMRILLHQQKQLAGGPLIPRFRQHCPLQRDAKYRTRNVGERAKRKWQIRLSISETQSQRLTRMETRSSSMGNRFSSRRISTCRTRSMQLTLRRPRAKYLWLFGSVDTICSAAAVIRNGKRATQVGSIRDIPTVATMRSL